MNSRIKTNPVRVKIYTDEYLMQGLVHTKPGGYRERASDLLNDPTVRFLVLTDAWFRPAKEETASFRSCPSLMVRIEDIKLLIPFEDREDVPRPTAPGASSTW